MEDTVEQIVRTFFCACMECGMEQEVTREDVTPGQVYALQYTCRACGQDNYEEFDVDAGAR